MSRTTASPLTPSPPTPPATAPAEPPPPASPSPRLTAEEFGLRYAGQRVEYVHGCIREVPMAGGLHGLVCNLIAFYLTQFVRRNDLGRVFTNDTFVRVAVPDDPERVYGPDVVFISYTRLPRVAPVPVGVLTTVPDLVVEVRSPSDPWAVVFSKVGDYLTAGTTAVVVLDPHTRTASVYRDRPDCPQQLFAPDAELTLPDVLPGFAVPLTRLFD